LGAGSSDGGGSRGGGGAVQQRQAEGPQSSSGAGAFMPDLISLDSESAEAGAAAVPAGGRR
jgi:hypothetical protein